MVDTTAWGHVPTKDLETAINALQRGSQKMRAAAAAMLAKVPGAPKDGWLVCNGHGANRRLLCTAAHRASKRTSQLFICGGNAITLPGIWRGSWSQALAAADATRVPGCYCMRHSAYLLEAARNIDAMVEEWEAVVKTRVG